jgi:hypothetical protein
VRGREGYSSHHRGGPPLGDQMVATSILEQRYWAMSWEKLGDAGSRPYRGSGKSEARCFHSRSSGRCSRADDRRPVPDSTDVAQAAWKRTQGRRAAPKRRIDGLGQEQYEDKTKAPRRVLHGGADALAARQTGAEASAVGATADERYGTHKVSP